MRLLAFALLAITLSLGACSPDDPPPAAPTSAPTTAANPDATLAPMPDVATEDSHSGVTQFLKYYLDVLSFASETGNVTELVRLSAASCDACTSYVAAIEDIYRSGGSITGGDRSFKEAEIRYAGQNSESFATATIHVGRSEQRGASGTIEKRTKSSATTLTFGIVGPAAERQISRISQGAFE